MTNQPQLPAHLQGLASRGLADKARSFLGSTQPPHVSIQGNTFTLIDSSNTEIPLGPAMQACIADVSDVKCKKYFAREWEPNSNDPPDCWSANGVAPSREAPTPQARTCAECKWNMRGSKVSKISGAAIKACRDEVWLALILPQYPGMLFQLVITPGSFETWGAYLRKFKQMPGLDLVHILTQFSFVPKVNGVIDFAATNYIDAALADAAGKALGAKATDIFVGRNDVPIQSVLAAPSGTPILPEAHPQQVQQPVPFVPASALVAPTPLPAANQTAMVGPAAGIPAEPQQRRRRRTAAEMAAAQNPAPQPTAQTQAPFMQGNGATPAPNFGIQEGAAPNADLMNTLDSLFGKK